MSAPIVWATCDTCFKDGDLCLGNGSDNWSNNGECDGWKIDTLGDTVALAFIGIILTVCTLHISNGWAWISRQLSTCALASDRHVGSDGVRSHLLPRPEGKYENTSETSAPQGSLAGEKQTVISVKEESQRRNS